MVGINYKPPTFEEMQEFWKRRGHDVYPDGSPMPKKMIFSKTDLENNGKTLMAHVMVELGIFPSVGQAKKNGWDKPLEIGNFCVTKKKITFEIIA